MIHLTIDEYLVLVKGDFSLRPCTECENGVLYIDGTTGELVSQRTYQELAPNDINMYAEDCDVCYGLGKVVRFD